MVDVSYIVPFYNGGATLIRCLDSIFEIGIEESHFEVIVVDDNSPESALDVLKDYLTSHSNIRMIRHNENKCQGGAKNTGIKEALGKYIVFADQDDVVISANQRLAIRRVLKTEPDMLACKWKVLDENEKMLECGVDLPEGQAWDGKTYCEKFFDTGKSLAPWSYVYRRDFLSEVAHPMAEGVLMEDSDWVAWHLFFAKKIEYLALPIYLWVMNPVSITHGLSWKHKADYVKFGYRKIKDSQVYAKTSKSFGATMQKDGQYNIEHTFKKLWKVDDYFLFYRHVGNEVLDELKKMEWSRRTSFMLHHRYLTCYVLCVAGSVLKVANLVRKS